MIFTFFFQLILSIDRFIAIRFPVYYRLMPKEKYIITVYVTAICAGFLPLLASLGDLELFSAVNGTDCNFNAQLSLGKLGYLAFLILSVLMNLPSFLFVVLCYIFLGKLKQSVNPSVYAKKKHILISLTIIFLSGTLLKVAHSIFRAIMEAVREESSHHALDGVYVSLLHLTTTAEFFVFVTRGKEYRQAMKKLFLDAKACLPTCFKKSSNEVHPL